jgi:integrase
MASIQKTKNGYRVQLYLKGNRASKTFVNKRDAMAWIVSVEGGLNEPQSNITLLKVLERYRDEITPRNTGARWERLRIDHLINIGVLPTKKKIGEVTTEDISKFRDARLHLVKPSSVLREIGILSAVFEVARKEWKLIAANPVRDVKKPTKPSGRNRLISWHEIKSMLRGFKYQPFGEIETVSQAIAVCFLLALRTGMRAGDLVGLTWANIKDRHAIIPVDKVGRKKGIGRDVPLSKKAVRLVNKMRGYHDSSVFDIKSATLDARFRTIRDRQGLSGFTFHDSRHCAATWIALSGKLSILQMTKMFGWTDPKWPCAISIQTQTI